MADSRTDAVSSLPEPLTDREHEILVYLVGGLSNHEIALRMHLAHRTVKWYNSQIYGKLGVSNRKDAIERVAVLGLLAPSPESAGRHNLPLQTTPFIGRQQELSELSRLLADPTIKLVTILAPGGMGKTRLALAEGERQRRHFPDGVFFVPLASLSSPDDIVTTIAENVGFSFYGSAAPEQQLLDYFRERNTLLVLDNFEHLLDGTPLVTSLLQAAAQVKLLVTSRERLNLSGETLFTLSGLHFPDWETPEDALEYDAVKLFMQSARRVQPEFALHADELIYLARVCRLTAGMPLGIQLAAAWVGTLSLEKIAQEIQQGIDILETEWRDVPERHRSIRATFDYTWTQLNEEEQSMFARLSVFRGGFTGEAASAVAGASVRTLRHLADKALLHRMPTNRYEIHELLRQYASEKLRAAPNERDRVEALYGVYFVEFLYQRRDDSKNHKQVQFIVDIEAEIENVRAAWDIVLERGDFEAIGKSTESIYRFYREKAWYLQGANSFEATIQTLRAGAQSPTCTEVVAQLLARTAFLLSLGGDKDRAFQQAAESLDMLDQLGRHSRAFTALEVLAGTQVLVGKLDEGAAYATAAYAVAQENGDKWGMAIALAWQATILLVQSRFDDALHDLLESIRLFNDIGDRWGVAWMLGETGYISWMLGDYASAEGQAQESYTIAEETRSSVVRLMAKFHLGHIAWAQGRLAEAEQYYRDTLTISQAQGTLNWQAGALQGLGNLARLQGNFPSAAHSLERALNLYKSTSANRDVAMTHVYLGQVSHDAGDFVSAYHQHQIGLDLCRNSDWRWGMAHALNHLGQAASALGNYEQARRCFREALSIAQEIGVKPLVLDTLVSVAEHRAKHGRLENTVELLAFSQQHMASTYETKRRAKALLDQFEAELGSGAFIVRCQQGYALDLTEAVRIALTDLVE